MLIDLTGQRFGRLTVLNRAEDSVSKSGRRRVRWLCQCDCGNTTIVYSDNLKAGKSTSCRCYQNEMIKKRFSTHGETDTRLYSIWCEMKARCHRKSNHAYDSYGGRGITVCDEWRNDFCAFSEWANSHGYGENLSIDRVDNDAGYSPSNCRWVDSVAQANNRRSNHNITYNGETHTVTEWAQKFNKNPKTIFSRLYTGWDPVEAITK